ncbi:hypothetical protein GCM10027074_36950 [Streptomyces deserti]
MARTPGCRSGIPEPSAAYERGQAAGTLGDIPTATGTAPESHTRQQGRVHRLRPLFPRQAAFDPQPLHPAPGGLRVVALPATQLPLRTLPFGFDSP